MVCGVLSGSHKVAVRASGVLVGIVHHSCPMRRRAEPEALIVLFNLLQCSVAYDETKVVIYATKKPLMRKGLILFILGSLFYRHSGKSNFPA